MSSRRKATWYYFVGIIINYYHCCRGDEFWYHVFCAFFFKFFFYFLCISSGWYDFIHVLLLLFILFLLCSLFLIGLLYTIIRCALLFNNLKLQHWHFILLVLLTLWTVVFCTYFFVRIFVKMTCSTSVHQNMDILI